LVGAEINWTVIDGYACWNASINGCRGSWLRFVIVLADQLIVAGPVPPWGGVRCVQPASAASIIADIASRRVTNACM
jgi:hypothetical protein